MKIETDHPEFASELDRWREGIAYWLHDLDLATDVRLSGDTSDTSCDAVLEVTLTSTDAHTTAASSEAGNVGRGNLTASRAAFTSKVDVPAAVVDFLVYSTVPPVHIWIRDVRVSPEISVKAQWHPLPKTTSTRSVDLGSEAIPGVSTNLVERHPLASWSFLGGLLLPPFLFSEADPMRVEQTRGDLLRRHAAFGLARKLKREASGDSIIDSLRIAASERGRELRIRAASSKLGAVRIWLDAAPQRVYRALWRDGIEGEGRIALAPVLENAVVSGLLRIEARTRDGKIGRYSLSLSAPTPGRVVSDGGGER